MIPPSPFLKAMKEIAVYLGKKIDGLSTVIKEKKESEPVNFTPVVSALSRVEGALKSMPTPEFSGEVTIDTTSMESSLKEVAKELKGLSTMEMPEMDNTEAMLKMMYECMQKQNELLMEGLGTISKGISGVKTYDVVKINADQMRMLTGSMKGGVGVARTPMATRVSNTTVAIANASTEGSYTFPSGTVGWMIKVRDQGTLGYYSWTTGKLPTSGDGTTYMTIPQNFLRSQSDVDYSGKTIYLGAEVAATFEIEVFTQ